MRTTHLKQLLAVIFGLAALIAAWITIGRLGDLVEATGSGADPDARFTPALGVVDPAAVHWGRDEGDLIRPVGDSVRRSVAESYLSALAILDGDRSMDGVDPAAYLTGPALRAISAAGGFTPIERRHRLRVTFHSADGQIIEAHDSSRLVFDFGTGDRLVVTETAVVVMVQVDGSWHLRHRVSSSGAANVLPGTEGPTNSLEAAIDVVSDAIFFGDRSGLRAVAVPIVVSAIAVVSAIFILVVRTRPRPIQEEST